MLWLDFLEEDREWLDKSGGVDSPPPLSTDDPVTTAREGWVEADPDPVTVEKSTKCNRL